MADGLHDIAVTGLDGTAVDMAIITVGPNTSLENYNIFVDDDDPSVTYTGHWNLDQSTFHAGNVPSGLPVGNTTHTSNTVGDIMGFTFAGMLKRTNYSLVIRTDLLSRDFDICLRNISMGENWQHVFALHA